MSIAAPGGTHNDAGGTGAALNGVSPSWRGGIVFALAAHAAVAAGFVAWQFGHQPPPQVAAAITIDLAPMVSAPPVPETAVRIYKRRGFCVVEGEPEREIKLVAGAVAQPLDPDRIATGAHG